MSGPPEPNLDEARRWLAQASEERATAVLSARPPRDRHFGLGALVGDLLGGDIVDSNDVAKITGATPRSVSRWLEGASPRSMARVVDLPKGTERSRLPPTRRPPPGRGRGCPG